MDMVNVLFNGFCHFILNKIFFILTIETDIFEIVELTSTTLKLYDTQYDETLVLKK